MKKSIAASLISLMVLTSCGQPKSTTTDSQTTTTPADGGGALPAVNPKYPGPYETVVVDGAEMKQGRFPEGRFGGSLVRAIFGADPKVFNPWTASDTGSRDLANLMFSGLVNIDPYTGDVIPEMARSFKIDPDGVTYTTVLRKGLKWSDGKPITAEDVAFTWNVLVKGGYGNSSLRDVTTIDGKSPTVTVVDELTNKYVTAKPFAPFARQLGMPIAPKHIVEPIIQKKDGRQKFDQLWTASTDPKSLVTSGPYVLDRYIPAQRVEFSPSKTFYMVNKEGKRLPYLQKLIYQIVPDVNAVMLKFKAKEIDLTPVRMREVADLLAQQTDGNYKLYNLGPSIGTMFLMFNMNQRKSPKTGKPYVQSIKSKWFNDVNFRQAVNHAVNRDNIIQNYLKGIGQPSFGSESPASPFFSKALQSFPTDPAYAMSLLEKSGFKKKPDGFLYDKDGNKVEFDLLGMAGSTMIEFMGPSIADDLKKLGMKVNFQPINFNILVDKTGTALDWEACLMALSAGDPLEPNDGANVWKSTGRLHMFDQRLPDSKGEIVAPDARPWEKRLDEIFAQGAVTLDKTKRKALYDEYQKVIYDEVPFIYLVNPPVIVGVRNDLGNYDPTQLSQSANGLHNLEEMYRK